MAPGKPADIPAQDLVRPRTALLSVSDKAGLVELAVALHRHGVQLVSTGGTRSTLTEADLPTVGIETVTGLPEMMDGRVKTLHPKVHGGLLAVRGHPGHEADMARHGIHAIDLVCVNLYPFEATAARPGVGDAEVIENIDIGGPCMIRSAAKNHAAVAVLTDPQQYGPLCDELDACNGHTTLAHRRRLAQAAYARTAGYDQVIATWMQRFGD